MFKIKVIGIVLSGFIILLFNFCKKEYEIDKQKPEINLSNQDAFPQNCDTIYFGEAFNFKALFTDNAALGSVKAFSIDIHNNFDHHSHSTEHSDCSPDSFKQAVNPYIFIQDYDIPAGLNSYEATLTITIPSENNIGLFDDGDYHFFMSLSDKEGWSVQKGLSIKMLHR